MLSSRGVLKVSPTGKEERGWIYVPGLINSAVIFTTYQVAFTEKVQVLHAFKEMIHVYCFGKSAGQATFGGKILSVCDNPPNLNLVAGVYENIRAYKGKGVVVSGPGGMCIKGVISGLQMGLAAETDNTADFNLSMIVVSSVASV